LWIAEGFTAYYENKLTLRAGFNDQNAFVNKLAGAVAAVENTPGAKVQSAAMASYDAWIKQYRPDENSSNNSISYYSKGEVIGLLMDLAIANATKGAKSLDDVMKAMYLQGKTQGRGYTDAEFKAMVEKVSGISFTSFWDKYVTGTEPVDYKTYFAYAGVTVKDDNEGKSTPYLGVASRKTEGRMFITAVSRNSAAWTSGLNVNDELLSINGVPIEAAIERMPELTSKKVGDVVNIKVGRDGKVVDFAVTLKANPSIRLVAKIDENATPAQKAVLKRWTGI
jgi:predicted metalloprotease with PDZ domain